MAGAPKGITSTPHVNECEYGDWGGWKKYFVHLDEGWLFDGYETGHKSFDTVREFKEATIVPSKDTYSIVRFFRDKAPPRHQKVVVRGLTLEAARAHCSDPETSSSTCKSSSSVQRTTTHGAWFDGYRSES